MKEMLRMCSIFYLIYLSGHDLSKIVTVHIHIYPCVCVYVCVSNQENGQA